jgi:hypothetical protein
LSSDIRSRAIYSPEHAWIELYIARIDNALCNSANGSDDPIGAIAIRCQIGLLELKGDGEFVWRDRYGSEGSSDILQLDKIETGYVSTRRTRPRGTAGQARHSAEQERSHSAHDALYPVSHDQ